MADGRRVALAAIQLSVIRTNWHAAMSFVPLPITLV